MIAKWGEAVAKPKKIADVTELMEFLTACIREDPSGTGGLKAAELLAKTYGLLSDRGAVAAEVPRIIDDIVAAGDTVPTGKTEGGAPDG